MMDEENTRDYAEAYERLNRAVRRLGCTRPERYAEVSALVNEIRRAAGTLVACADAAHMADIASKR